MENILISACLLGIACRYDGESKPKLSAEEINSLKEKYNLIPICPEIYGGLPTPRTGSERVGDKVLMRDGTDVTENYRRGAEESLKFARILDCKTAVLKSKSPSCGKGLVYDGTFTGTLTEADGVTAELLSASGIKVLGEENIREIL